MNTSLFVVRRHGDGFIVGASTTFDGAVRVARRAVLFPVLSVRVAQNSVLVKHQLPTRIEVDHFVVDRVSVTE